MVLKKSYMIYFRRKYPKWCDCIKNKVGIIYYLVNLLIAYLLISTSTTMMLALISNRKCLQGVLKVIYWKLMLLSRTAYKQIWLRLKISLRYKQFSIWQRRNLPPRKNKHIFYLPISKSIWLCKKVGHELIMIVHHFSCK